MKTRFNIIRLFVAAAISALSIALVGCTTNVTATLDNLTKLQSGMGTLNPEFVQLGSVLDLDPESHMVGNVLKVPYSQGDSSTTSVAATYDVSANSGLTVSVDAKVTLEEHGAIESAVNNNTQLTLENASGEQFNDPLKLINAPAAAASLKSLMTNHQSHHYILINAGTHATKVTFHTKNSSDNSLTVAVGGKSLDCKVSYEFEGAVNAEISNDNAKGYLAFFKILEITSAPDGSLTVGAFPGKISDYNLNQGLR
jgi:hypothetical protein